MANTPITSIRIPEDLKDWAQRQAMAEGRSLGNWFVRVLQQHKDQQIKARGRK